MKMITHLVVDDLREFSDKTIEDVVYLRTLGDAMLWLNGPNASDFIVENLYLDFDLGINAVNKNPETSLPFVSELYNIAVFENATGRKGHCVNNVYVITANPIGRDRLMGFVEEIATNNFMAINATDVGLINTVEW